MNKELVIEMYKKGQGTATIAFKLKVTASLVLKIVNEAGILRERKASLRIANQLRAGQKRGTLK